MKIKSGFMLREIAGQWVVIPIGARVVEFNNIMTLSESGAFLWRLLEQEITEEEMIAAMLKEYDADEQRIRQDINKFLADIRAVGLSE